MYLNVCSAWIIFQTNHPYHTVAASVYNLAVAYSKYELCELCCVYIFADTNREKSSNSPLKRTNDKTRRRLYSFRLLRQVKPHSKQHCGWLRHRCLEGCIVQVPPVVKLRHSKVVVCKPQAGLLCCCCSSLTPLLWSIAGQLHVIVCWYVTEKHVRVASYFTRNWNSQSKCFF